MTRRYDYHSRVEPIALARSGRAASYPPAEKIRIIEVPDFPSLGKLTALRFLEWLQLNPEGVVSLPTGKTPEYFIKWTGYYLEAWKEAGVQKELAAWGLDSKQRPRMEAVTFVQIDEFYPINPQQKNSFNHYIQKFYVKGFGLDRDRVILMDTWRLGCPGERNLGQVFEGGRVDLLLRYRQPASKLEQLQYRAIHAADQYAMEYEARIESLGGIGFFLGGIGPDGHIGFNIRGSDHYSTTRLTPINYETAAAAATDLGGLENARDRVVMTVGLRSITRNRTAAVLVTAAGESKAAVVRNAVENPPSVLYPATALQGLPGARFYLTQGAARDLVERRCQALVQEKPLSDRSVERILIDLSSRRRKRLLDLTPADLEGDRIGRVLGGRFEGAGALKEQAVRVEALLREKVARGLEEKEGLTFLHTAPHHDDIMLGYLPYIIRLVRSPKNTHYFATLTSGFTSVTNDYTLSALSNLRRFLERRTFAPLLAAGYFAPGRTPARNEDVYYYLDGVAADSPEMRREAEARRALRVLLEMTGAADQAAAAAALEGLEQELRGSYPGKKDIPAIQQIKGTIREWEEELLWGHLGFNSDNIFHLRLGFYTGDIFTPQPELERDVRPVLKLLRELKPDVITLALDPEGSGPDTHYKVLQAVAEAVRVYRAETPQKDLKIWGYRNVWYRFHPSEANIFAPVSMNSLAIMKEAFHTCFGSQRSASFPSYEYDGPFCDLARRIMVEQYTMVMHCLGRDFFYKNPVPRLRASRGLNFIREMDCEEFSQEALSLRRLTEAQPF
ncbi:MAG: Glucosamine-6-phosphate deaminase [candidate division TA06 bacterium ADurb.Bin417]|uniref:Glucosamine-6-phosphate deaminase n=1 Tax=candidate division TA06 bacterium ADurb.Bin417 TaxID=1852828 RepID=A0A1V5MGI8_UNCT6|nr:MAG: Glucosamine-6-phosphate deaminase [candidate division TA06 bacterium ADurb.Bin417]